MPAEGRGYTRVSAGPGQRVVASPPEAHSAHRSTNTLLMQPLKLRRALDLGKPPRKS